MQMTSINCNGNLIDLSKPKIMGILNLTPDSFFDGGNYKSDVEILNQTEKMLQEGATFIDIGGQSTRPNATFLNVNDEQNRVLPIVQLLLKKFPQIIISIDTFHSQVADICLQNGAALINDISAGSFDAKMYEIIAKHKVPLILMHSKGTPQTMQNLANYNNLIQEITFYFSQKIAQARSFGINDLIIDPGFGFAKTTEQNFELLQKLESLKIINLPILIGLSRKSMIYKTLEIQPKEALNGTTCLHTIALLKGAKILRVHDVKETAEVIKLVNKV